MKFKVREDFVVHHTKQVKIVINGEDRLQPQTNSYYGGQEVEFDATKAAEHLHKLEPVDKDARAFLAAQIAPVAAPVEGAGINQDALAAAIAKGVAQAMAAIQARQSTPAA